MRVVQNQDRLIFEAGCFKFVGDFAKCVFNESFLQRWLWAATPFTQYVFDCRVPIVFGFVREFLRYGSHLIEVARATFAIDSRITGDKAFACNASALFRRCMSTNFAV